MPFWESLRRTFGRPAVYWALLALLALVLGALAAVLAIPAPRVGVIYFSDVIWSDTVQPLQAQLRYAEADPSIRAVVIEVDSPGGEAAASERLYFDILRLRRSKPVVVMVDSMAASGGYYMAAAGDEIVASPASSIGNIGVIAEAPSPSLVVEEYLFTGPFKAFGNPRDAFMRQMDLLKSSFLQCVAAQRGERLKVDLATLSRGELYVGTAALQVGLVDSLGSRDDAVARAAWLAGIDHYSVVDVAAEMVKTGAAPSPTPLPPDEVYQRLEAPPWASGFYFLYLAPQEGGAK